MTKNTAGRCIPESIPGIGPLKPYQGVFAGRYSGRKNTPSVSEYRPGEKKLLNSIKDAIRATGLNDGMTISFHHHFRNGDYLVNMVVEAIADLGIKGICLAPSSLQSVHAPLVEYIKQGVITEIQTSGLRGRLADTVSRGGLMEKPVIFRSHGGRARAIETGELKIDVAFIAAPCADEYGNVNGVNGPAACGSMGYAKVDAEFADKVVVVTDNLVPYPAMPISIPQTQVDYVVKVDKIGDPNGILTGSARITENPMELLIAETVARVIEYSGYLKDGMSFQTGVGGISIAAAHYMGLKMKEMGIRGSFVTGGITGYMVKMLNEGLFEALLDTQCFDIDAVKSLKENPNHAEMSASFYANPCTKGCAINMLDVVILGATEIDVNFNTNVLTGSDGRIIESIGGHQDTAAASKLCIIVAPLIRGRIPIVVDEVTTLVTPGECIDVVVTERGVAVNPRRKDLMENLKGSGIKLCTIEELKNTAEKLTGKPQKPELGDKITGVVQFRDGSIIDVVRRVVN